MQALRVTNPSILPIRVQLQFQTRVCRPCESRIRPSCPSVSSRCSGHAYADLASHESVHPAHPCPVAVPDTRMQALRITNPSILPNPCPVAVPDTRMQALRVTNPSILPIRVQLQFQTRVCRPCESRIRPSCPSVSSRCSGHAYADLASHESVHPAHPCPVAVLHSRTQALPITVRQSARSAFSSKRSG